MSRARCCVPGCLESGSSHSVLHGFPNPEKNPELFRSWIYAVGGDILSLDNIHIYKLRRVCHAHFEQKYCCRFNRISKIAVPTINLPGPLALPQFTHTERRPLRVIQNLLIDAPSTSRDPIIFDEPVYQENTLLQIEENKNMAVFNDVVIFAPEKPVPQETALLQVEENKNMAPINVKVKKLTKHVATTKAEKELYKKLIAIKIKLSKCRRKASKKSLELRSARKLISNPEFLKLMNSWTSSAKLFTMMQFRESKKKGKGRRFSTDEKIVALTMLKHSPKAYRFLRKLFILPSCQTLSKLLNKCYLKPGINKQIFQQLKTRGEKMKELHKLCILSFDEMQLRAGIAFNERKDKVSGFITDGQETKKILADHAQVFLIRGLIKNYKQPVAYSFSSGATKGPELAKQLRTVIRELQHAGFSVIATVCDQGTNNRQAIKLLTEETRQNYLRDGKTPRGNFFCVNSSEIFPIYDPPHLLKGIRNNLITKDLSYQIKGKSGTAKWRHLELLYQEDPGYKGIKLMPTLTAYHIIPSKIRKMKVKYASQIFSRKVAASMGYFAEKHIIPEECKETADFLYFMDNLFDSLNGSYLKNKNAKPLLGPVTPSSPHKQIWRDAKLALQTVEFINKQTNKKEHVPTIKGWISTLEGMEGIVNKLEKEYQITSIFMRHLNQDPLENFFGAIRSHGCRNTNPTVEQFESAFTTLLINNLTSVHAPGSNCEKDNAESLYSLIINTNVDSEGNSICEINIDDLQEIELTEVASKSDPRVMAPLEYISGYFVKKSKQRIWRQCKLCQKSLCSTIEKEYIKHREFAGRSWLQSPSENLVQTLSEMQDISNYIIKKYIHKPLLLQYAKLMASCLINLNYMDCPAHKEKIREFLTSQILRFFIFTYCKNINKIIYGKKSVDDDSDEVQMLAKAYFNKLLKRK